MLDPNIALGFRGMQIADPMEHMGKAMSLSNMGMQNQFMQSKMTEQNRLSNLAQSRQQAFAASGGDSEKFMSMLTQNGDLEGAQAFQEHTLKQQKDRAEIKSKGITDAKGLQELRVRTAQGIKAGGTVEHVLHGIRQLQAVGDEEGVRFLTSGLEQNPNPTREHIAAYLDPVIAAGLSAEQFSMPNFKDAGGQLVNVNPNAQFAPINKTQTPESIASNQTTRRGQNMADARSREANNNSKAPAGFRFLPDGSLEAIPGGPADVKNAANTEANRIKAEAAEGKARIVNDKVDEALSKVGFTTSGLTGKAMSMVAGTGAYDLDKTVETIKANLGFKELADMRAASPTGGALGQVAVKELEFLQAAVSSLDVGQSEAQLRKNLMTVKRHYGNWKNTVAKADKQRPSTGVKFLGFE